MPTGTVKFFNPSKGFGFITPDDGSKDVFVPAASIASSGIPALTQGLRLAFETRPDTRGPKAVELKLIAGAEPSRVPGKKPEPAATYPSKPRLTVYLDPASELADHAVAELREAGLEPEIVDYIANPPTSEQLKALSLLLRDGDQSLVRRYDPMFMELRLDDRFISDNEYWQLVHEHPFLINGPVLATIAKARVCRTENAVQDFVAAITTGRATTIPKPKALSDRLLRLVTGNDEIATAPVQIAALPENSPEPPVSATAEIPSRKEAKEKIKAKAPAKPKAKKTARKISTSAKVSTKAEAEPKPAPRAKTKAKKVRTPAVKKPRKKAASAKG